MSGAGTTMSMIKTLKSNSQLLNRNNLFTQLKNINNKTIPDYKHQPMSNEALASIRRQERIMLKNTMQKKRIIGVLVVVPTAIILLVVVYLLVQSLT